MPEPQTDTGEWGDETVYVVSDGTLQEGQLEHMLDMEPHDAVQYFLDGHVTLGGFKTFIYASYPRVRETTDPETGETRQTVTREPTGFSDIWLYCAENDYGEEYRPSDDVRTIARLWLEHPEWRDDLYNVAQQDNAKDL